MIPQKRMECFRLLFDHLVWIEHQFLSGIRDSRKAGSLPPITKTIQVRRTRHAGHCWRSRDELIRDVLLWTPTHGRAKAGRPARTYIQQLCEDTGCCPEDLPRAMNDREEWRERVRDIRPTSATWWWWRKSIHQSWLAKGLGLGLLCWGFKGVQEEIPWEEASTVQIGSVAFPRGQSTSPQLHPCHRLFDQDEHQGSSSPSL